MTINWTQVETEIEKAVVGILKKDLDTVSKGAKAQLSALIEVGKSIEQAALASPPTISAAEFASLKLSQQRGIEGVLQTSEAIGIVAAEQAAAAAWGVVETAILAAVKIPGL